MRVTRILKPISMRVIPRGTLSACAVGDRNGCAHVGIDLHPHGHRRCGCRLRFDLDLGAGTNSADREVQHLPGRQQLVVLGVRRNRNSPSKRRAGVRMGDPGTPAMGHTDSNPQFAGGAGADVFGRTQSFDRKSKRRGCDRRRACAHLAGGGNLRYDDRSRAILTCIIRRRGDGAFDDGRFLYLGRSVTASLDRGIAGARSGDCGHQIHSS